MYKSTSELGTPLYTGQTAGVQWCPLYVYACIPRGWGGGQSTHQLPEVAVGLDQIYLSIRDPSLYRTASWVPMSSIARFHCTCVCEHTLEPSNAPSSYHRTSCHHHINAHHPSAITRQSLESYLCTRIHLPTHTYMYTYLCRHVWLCTVLAQRGPGLVDTTQ